MCARRSRPSCTLALKADLPAITGDTMPGELSNSLAGRVANVFNLRGPNYIVDAACASAMAAMDASIEGLVAGQFDTVVTGGVDRNMGVSSFIKSARSAHSQARAHDRTRRGPTAS
jgi:acyl transferase domain-containing protein